MKYSNLFESVLKAPVEKNSATHLFAVSGYATPALIYQLMDINRPDIKLDLIYGMAKSDGVFKSHHEQFQNICKDQFLGRVRVFYHTGLTPVHAKVYAWEGHAGPVIGYCGSANFTMNGFGKNLEAVSEDDPIACKRFYCSCLPDCVCCLDPKVNDKVSITDKITWNKKNGKEKGIFETGPGPQGLVGFESIELDFIDKSGGVPIKSGINWGQRPNRDPDQAYIPIRKDHFLVVCDDGFSFDAVIAQDGNKALECPSDNSVIGKYLRDRMGVDRGKLVGLDDFKKYGRTSVRVSKIDEETYYMDFSV